RVVGVEPAAFQVGRQAVGLLAGHGVPERGGFAGGDVEVNDRRVAGGGRRRAENQLSRRRGGGQQAHHGTGTRGAEEGYTHLLLTPILESRPARADIARNNSDCVAGSFAIPPHASSRRRRDGYPRVGASVACLN